MEYLPGQFDQRADSAAQCIQIISQKERPIVRTAKVYLLEGSLSADELSAVKKYVINPVESREASLEPFDTLKASFSIPTQVDVLEGFHALTMEALSDLHTRLGLAMDLDDLHFCQGYFAEEGRDPTITEIRVIDTYWSDHCRHTTFRTIIDGVTFEEALLQSAYGEYLAMRGSLGRAKPVTLMDLATIASSWLKKTGRLEGLDESEEINACTVKIKVDVEGELQDWLLLFKNETHNHPTEIEPFGGAATCIGGAIRDPLSGRSYVYAAMRVTGGANPLRPVAETIPGKLPQRKLVATAAAGYSSYGNQIGLATGEVNELYHDGYAAKHMEIGAVIAATPAENVRREQPVPGDVVILLGGRTGRDGCGGATGSSKAHDISSLETCGAEVQKGNAPEERKLQRLFRNSKAARLIKRCNDFGAGGVSVAIGELADGVEIDLNTVPKKYEGLDGTELAISESQERMAVVVAAEDAEAFRAMAAEENLEATAVAVVTARPSLTMRWNGNVIVDLSRAFLDSNGAEKHVDVTVEAAKPFNKTIPNQFTEGYISLAGDLNVCSRRGLSERFDSTIGAGTVLMPFGGARQLTPTQVMAHKISIAEKDTSTVSLMSWGYNPYIAEKSPFHSAYLAVVESVSKLVAAGAGQDAIYLTFQEYFEKLGRDPVRWGKPLAALLGAFMAQKDLGLAAIGGKDSMSGSFEQLDVPPTLVSFAVTTSTLDHIHTPEFKGPGHPVVLLVPDYDTNGLPVPASLKKVFQIVERLAGEGKLLSAYTPGFGGVAEAVMKMAFGNHVGFRYQEDLTLDRLFGYCYGGFVLELSERVDIGISIGETMAEPFLDYGKELLCLNSLLKIYEDKLEPVYPCNIKTASGPVPVYSYGTRTRPAPKVKTAKPVALIPVFAGTNCEYDTAKALAAAGAEPRIMVIRNLTSDGIARSADEFASALKAAQMVVIPGGFSGGDEPDGSAKFITSFFRNAGVKSEVTSLLDERDGLMCGICNGFQALIKLGLVPYGKIIDTDETCPTLTYNTIGRHQSRLVRIRIASNKSPWLSHTKVGDIYTVPISHGEGRFLAGPEFIESLAQNGQIATQYVDYNGSPTYDIHFNPNGSVCAVEAITSPDGRILGKMGHTERAGIGLYKNVPGNFDLNFFKSAVLYFK
ncbi:Phosphoribosylformylglycinamidine synthase [bioreactor metagenome]|uniref:Phosphoribosylformylglycinamidine synthase n=1 Tax=bioreactor metagenome TaxID=1076179 RepID=A0A644W6S6_9ZZZZ